jgi:type I restriction enzyme R subunit
MKRDWKQFSELRRSVQIRFQEKVDLREFEPKIQKLLDDHVVAMPAVTVVDLVNINDPNALQAVLKDAGVSEASRADRIASATRKVIHEKMEEDPSFYKRFSQLLEETIQDYRAKRISEKEYLKAIVDLAVKVAQKDRGAGLPESIKGNEDGQAFFGLLDGVLVDKSNTPMDKEEVARIALEIIEIIHERHIVDVWRNDVAQKRMLNAVDDYFFDILRDQRGVQLPLELVDELNEKVMNLAKARFPG